MLKNSISFLRKVTDSKQSIFIRFLLNPNIEQKLTTEQPLLIFDVPMSTKFAVKSSRVRQTPQERTASQFLLSNSCVLSSFPLYLICSILLSTRVHSQQHGKKQLSPLSPNPQIRRRRKTFVRLVYYRRYQKYSRKSF